MPATKALNEKIAELRLCKQKIIAAQNCLFDLRLMEEMEKVHSVLNSVDERIEQLEAIAQRASQPKKTDS